MHCKRIATTSSANLARRAARTLLLMTSMKASTKLIMLGTIGAGAAAGAVLAIRHSRAKKFQRNLDAVLSDIEAELDEPVIVSEEVVVVTEAGPFDVDMEHVPEERGIDPDDFRASK
jgi:hypothetical protein